MTLFKKTNPRRTLLRRTITTERSLRLSQVANPDVLVSLLLWLLFVVGCSVVLSLQLASGGRLLAEVSLLAVVLTISFGAAVYIYQYQPRLIRNHSRAAALVTVFLLLLAATKIGVITGGSSGWQASWGTGTAVFVAIVLVISYDQRFTIGMGTLYSILACLAVVGPQPQEGFRLQGIGLFLTMAAGVATCAFLLKEIRTRMKLLEVSALAAAVVFMMALFVKYLGYMGNPPDAISVVREAGYHGGAAMIGGMLMQALLPLIERMFRIATSMTLLDYSDANQPLLKRLAMEAPGTFSHSLLIGSIAEAAAEAIGCNGLLCRVGAYYHDIGKINKPKYFIENEMGSASKHKELSPAMSQLIIIAHVKDGVEMAREYGLPTVLHQFVESHHGTTLVEPFYNEARKKAEAQEPGRKPLETPPCESEFRYAGPKPKSKEAAIIMLADAVESAVRSLSDVTLAKVEAVVHNIAMRRLQDGQFDECDLTLRELSRIEASMSKSLAAHYHGRIAYPSAPDEPASLPDPAGASIASGAKA
jgi:putative nucleotidyltransferase with HDIG domain